MLLSVGIPKEIKPGEHRVSLTPKGVRVLVKHNAHVYVEEGAGRFSDFQDQAYQAAGADLIRSREELWRRANLIKKVKEPIGEEFSLFRSEHIIFTYLHLASPAERPLMNALVSSKAIAIAYETIPKIGAAPLLKPMSEIAGILSAYFAGVFQNEIKIKEGKILGIQEAKIKIQRLASEYPQIPGNLSPGCVMILGGGHVGRNAARTAALMNGTIFLSELSEKKRLDLEHDFIKEGSGHSRVKS